jgi:hypothetical protein
MSRTLLALCCPLLAVLAAPAAAQQGALDPQCAGAATFVQDACQKSADIFSVVAPQLGPGIAGGNAVFGGEGALGRLGAVSVGIRGNVVRSRLPRLEGVRLSATGPVSTDFETAEPYVPIPTADAALGLFGGIPIAPGVRLGALDALASVSYVPDYDDENVSVSATGQRLQFGYGARLGLLQESAFVPGVAVTYLRRDIPEAELIGRVSATAGGLLDDTIGVSGLRTETHAWRAVASKRLAILGIAVGGGQDRYVSRARLRGVLNESTIIGPVRFVAEGFDFRQRLTRTNYFADVSLHFPLLTLVGEIGQASGGAVPRTHNAFDGDYARAEEPVTYGAVGVRLRF